MDVSLPYIGWGIKFFDYDNDGWLGLLVVNGHVYPQIEGAYPGGMYRSKEVVLSELAKRNIQRGRDRAGSGDERSGELSRGAAFGDYDEDGDVDVIVNDLDGPAMLMRNGRRKPGGTLVALEVDRDEIE